MKNMHSPNSQNFCFFSLSKEAVAWHRNNFFCKTCYDFKSQRGLVYFVILSNLRLLQPSWPNWWSQSHLFCPIHFLFQPWIHSKGLELGTGIKLRRNYCSSYFSRCPMFGQRQLSNIFHKQRQAHIRSPKLKGQLAFREGLCWTLCLAFLYILL